MEIKLRKWNPNDLDNLVLYANNRKIAANLTDGFPYPYTKEKGMSFIKMAMDKEPATLFAIELNGAAVGGIGIHPQTDIYCRNAELGYWLAEPFWGKGIITQAITKIVTYGFENFDIDRIFARPFGRNIASHRVLEKTGFVLEARFEKTIIKNGIYEDELVYSKRR